MFTILRISEEVDNVAHVVVVARQKRFPDSDKRHSYKRQYLGIGNIAGEMIKNHEKFANLKQPYL